nr:hypothetical protein [Pseudonocardia sp. 73-21]
MSGAKRAPGTLDHASHSVISSDPTFSRASEPIQFTVQSSSRTPLR